MHKTHPHRPSTGARRAAHRRAAHLALACGVVFALALAALTAPALAMKIQKVTSPGGITAWLVEEHSVPLIALRFAFDGGSTQDPPDKPGVANFLTTMLDEGAGDIRSEAFQERLEELAVKMSFDVTRDTFLGKLQTLTENRDEAVRLLKLAINKPRFDKDAMERLRRAILAGLVFDSKDPDKVASKAWFEAAFKGHPYAWPVKGTTESVSKITPADLEAYRKRVFARDSLKVAVVGDIDAKALGRLLDEVFGDLPAKGDLRPVPEAKPPLGPVTRHIAMDVPQSVARFGHTAFKRKDPDFIPAYVLNYILGGGGFTSRLMVEVREKRGLAYSVYSYLYPLRRAAALIGGVATKNEGIAKSLAVIRDELARMAKEGPTREELANAKSYLIGSYPLRFDTSGKIASQLIWVQIEDLGIDYFDRRNGLIEAVSIEDIRRVARRLLHPDALIVTVVGRKAPATRAGKGAPAPARATAAPERG